MATSRKVYLHHIRRYKKQIEILSELLVSEREQWQDKVLEWTWAYNNLRKKYTATLGKEPQNVTLRRKGDDFYVVIDEKEIRVFAYDWNNRRHLHQSIDHSILKLSFLEFQKLEPKIDELREDIELFDACPMSEHELKYSDFSPREFRRILKWWGLYENERKTVDHLYKLKHDPEYRQTYETQKKEQEKAEAEARIKTRLRTTYIYLMKDTQTDYIKIGQSRNPTARESTLFSEKPCIHLLCAWEAESKEEKQLHTEFMHKQVRGEWFDLTDEEVESIKTRFADRKQWGNQESEQEQNGET